MLPRECASYTLIPKIVKFLCLQNSETSLQNKIMIPPLIMGQFCYFIETSRKLKALAIKLLKGFQYQKKGQASQDIFT